jgi:hypothetical protein
MKRKKMKRNRFVIKKAGLIWSLLSILALSVSCQEKTNVRFHVKNQIIDRNIFLDYKAEKTVNNVYPDTLIELKDNITLLKVDRVKSDIGTGLFFLSNKNQILEYAVDNWSFVLDIYLVDIDKDGVDEVLTVWSDESVFYIKIYCQAKGIKMCFKSNDIGNPDLWNGNKVNISKDDVLIFYQEEDATHVKSQLVYNKQLNKFELKDLKRINP